MVENKEEKNHEKDIVIVMDSGRQQPKDRYRKTSVKILSIMHVVCGVLSCLVGIFKLILHSSLYNPYRRMPFYTIGEGIFCGIPFLITGILGLISLKKTSYCKITAFLVFSIISSIFGLILILITVSLLHVAIFRGYALAIASHSSLLILGLIEAFLGIVSSGYSCHGCCGCCGNDQVSNGVDSSVVYVPTQGVGSETDEIPRIIKINMKDLSKQKATTVDGHQDSTYDEDENIGILGKYSKLN